VRTRFKWYPELDDNERPIWLDIGTARSERLDAFGNGMIAGLVLAGLGLIIIVLLARL
jgi:hypothetical protein